MLSLLNPCFSLCMTQVLAQRAKLARDEEMKKELELCNRIAAEHAQSRHREHFDSWLDVLGQIVDLATKVGEYHLLTGKYVTGSLLEVNKIPSIARGLHIFLQIFL
ncbi:hypothetical protein ATANTOWER_004338 [Ataeniobius toweri]|uniref:CPC1/SPEF2 domain-containing protein n=1 Tax=Ataeniobius toweri TaxID=208326 RepID=A0ABU7B4Q4_9TELE|nr:hypothetical protein [Ataeniobius toweri]